MEQELKGALIGMILGKAEVAKSNSYGCFLIIKSCPKEEQYVLLKKKILDTFDVKIKRKNDILKLETRSHSDFEFFRNNFYEKRKKVMPPDEVLKELTPAGLALLYMDCGYVVDNKKYYIDTVQYSLEDHKRIRQILRKRFDIWTTILRSNVTKLCQLYIAKKSAPLLESHIEDFILPCLKYKVIH